MPDADQPAAHEPQAQDLGERVDASVEESDPLLQPKSPQGFTFHDLVVGRDGLRAGWSLLLYVALLLAVLAGTGRLVHAVRHRGDVAKPGAAAQSAPQSAKPTPLDTSGPMSASPVLLAEGVSLFGVVVATWLMGKIERRPTSVYGLGGKHRLPNFFSGLGWGAAMLSLLVFALRATGLLVFDARQLFGASALRFGAVWFAGFLLVGLFEEYLFRGYLQFTLTRGINGIYDWLCSFGTNHASQSSNSQSALGFWIAALLVSFGFGFVHHTNVGESPIGLLAAALIAAVFCLSLWRTGSLWWAIGFHAAWDWAQSFFYGVADSGMLIQGHLFSTHPVGRPILSGGLTGPEGSLFILPIIGLTAVVIVLTLPRVRHDKLPARPTAASMD